MRIVGALLYKAVAVAFWDTAVTEDYAQFVVDSVVHRLRCAVQLVRTTLA